MAPNNATDETTTPATLSSQASRSPHPPRQHGVKGVYYAGEWLDFQDCDGKFNVSESRCSGGKTQDRKPCRRSASRTVAVPLLPSSSSSPLDSHKASNEGGGGDGSSSSYYDVCIIGAGCIGAAIARELSKYQLAVLWLEAADDVSQGATKGNSGIVHAGYDDKPGTNRAKFCWKGNQMFRDLDRDLRFGYQTNGSLVLAFKEEERKVLHELLERGKTNGVERLRIIEREEVLQREPHVNPNVVAALYAPDAGNVIPYVSSKHGYRKKKRGEGSSVCKAVKENCISMIGKRTDWNVAVLLFLFFCFAFHFLSSFGGWVGEYVCKGIYNCLGRKCGRQWCRITNPSTGYGNYSNQGRDDNHSPILGTTRIFGGPTAIFVDAVASSRSGHRSSRFDGLFGIAK